MGTDSTTAARRAMWRGLAFGVGLIVAGLLAWVWQARTQRPIAAGGALVGRPAPDFALPRVDGPEMRLADLRGRVVLLNVWATWCEPCKVEMPLLQRLAQEHPDQVVVLGVNYGEDPAKVQAFAAAYGLTFPLLLDPEHEVVRLYGVRGLPTTVVIDPEGIVRAVHLGALSEDDLRTYLRPLGVEP